MSLPLLLDINNKVNFAQIVSYDLQSQDEMMIYIYVVKEKLTSILVVNNGRNKNPKVLKKTYIEYKQARYFKMFCICDIGGEMRYYLSRLLPQGCIYI